MKHLKELGLDTSDASMCWAKSVNRAYPNLKPSFILELSERAYLGESMNEGSFWECIELTPAYTLQDILDMLPSQIDIHILNLQKRDGCWICFYMDNHTKSIVHLFSERECIDTVYNMLCWVIENKYLEFSNNE